MAAALEAASWRVPALWRASAGRCLYPCAIAVALALARLAAERLTETAPHLPGLV